MQRPGPKAARPAARPLRAKRGAAGQANRPSCCCCRHRGPVQIWPPGLPQAGGRCHIEGSPSFCILTRPILCRDTMLESEGWPVLPRALGRKTHLQQEAALPKQRCCEQAQSSCDKQTCQ